ncbi:hypothetical protein [Bacillus sp. 16GRE42]|uniref:hypothetical protein n=1 Tax=Bacillus sp. 16GRE42 TaxID=2778092 RepID=UPI001C9B227E|nr:hypothetical protein [Bacillus sp. 16GRE42]
MSLSLVVDKQEILASVMKFFEDAKGGPPAFRKKTTLRVCKILYEFSDNPVTNKNPKTALG